MNHLCLVISYDGSRYHGFQTQPRKDTVQQRLQEALQVVTGEQMKVNGSGRTDAGVHARSQYIDFHTSTNIPLDRWCLAMNSCLPEDIHVKRAYLVPEEFHARRSAFAKTYKYTVNCGRINDVFQRHMQYHFPRKIDAEQMVRASKQLLGEHDFTSFAATRSVRRSNIRTIREITIEDFRAQAESDMQIIQFTITGTGFLQHMVRIIIGTLLDVGIGKKSVQDVDTILNAKNRLLAGPTAPPHGLILWDVYYPEKFGVNLETRRNL